MKKILVIGAGRSSSSLIKYLLDHSVDQNWHVTIADMDIELAKKKANDHPSSRAIKFNITDISARNSEIESSDIVVSMLPANLHIEVAKDCIRYKKHLVTASYVSPELKALEKEVVQAGVLFLNEMGLDPGIDHMSAMQIIDKIKSEGGQITSFKSYCGGLIAPECDTNPWNYKFTWAPRNVVLAGQATARYLSNGKLKLIPPNRIFSDIEQIKVKGYGIFDAYANRDSLSYSTPYGIEDAKTVLRGTLRKKGYCKKWNALIKIGLTDGSYVIDNLNELSYKQLVESLLPSGYNIDSFLSKECKIKKSSKEYNAIKWLGLFSNDKISLTSASPAQILQALLEKKWVLGNNDIDMIVMHHEFEYKNARSKKCTFETSLVLKGKDQIQTAMALTVGLPMAIAVKHILNGNIKLKGIQIPLMKELYNPILQELEDFGIRFNHS